MPVYERNKIWWFRMKWKGTLIRKSSGLKGAEGKEFAKRMEAERRTALAHDEQGFKRKQKPIKFLAAAEAFIESKIKWAEKTRTLHNTSLSHLKKYFGDCFLDEITPEKIVQYQRARLKEKGAGRKTTTSKRTVNIEVGLIRLVLTKHKRWGRISDDVEFYDEKKDTGRALSQDEQDRLLTAARSSVSYSLFPAVLLSIHTGLRNEELRLLHWDRVDFIEGSIRVGKSKTEEGSERVVPLSQTALQTLKDWRSRFPNAKPEHFVFPSERYRLIGRKDASKATVEAYDSDPEKQIGSWRTAWRTAKKAVNVKCRWHDLRHTFVSRIAAGGATNATIDAVAGWRSPEMRKRYSHAENESNRKAVLVLDSTRVQ